MRNTNFILISESITAKYKYPPCIFYPVKVGLLFDDKRLEYRVMKKFQERGIPFTIMNDTIDITDVVLSDVPRDIMVIIVKDEFEAFRRIMSRMYGKDRFSRIIIGIDPGPKPGLVVVGDGYVVEKMHLSSVNEVRMQVDGIMRGYQPVRLTVRIGNGDIVNRNRIINSLVDDYEVEMVDERNTTVTILNRDVESAKYIAFTRGTPVRSRVNTVIRDGYLREIQRRSRIESGGSVTISKELAKRVALGEMTLDRAIEITRGRK